MAPVSAQPCNGILFAGNNAAPAAVVAAGGARPSLRQARGEVMSGQKATSCDLRLGQVARRRQVNRRLRGLRQSGGNDLLGHSVFHDHRIQLFEKGARTKDVLALYLQTEVTR